MYLLKRKHINKSRYSSFLFAILYVVVLSITSFHFHNSSLGSLPLGYESSLQNSNSHLFSQDDCPIVIFGKSGFNSLQISQDNSEKEFDGTSVYYDFIQTAQNQNFIFYFTSRGPPSYEIA